MATANPLPAPDDPILAALARAPVGKPFAPEHKAVLDQRLEDIRAGRVKLIPHADRAAWLAAHEHELGQREPDDDDE